MIDRRQMHGKLKSTQRSDRAYQGLDRVSFTFVFLGWRLTAIFELHDRDSSPLRICAATWGLPRGQSMLLSSVVFLLKLMLRLRGVCAPCDHFSERALPWLRLSTSLLSRSFHARFSLSHFPRTPEVTNMLPREVTL